MCYDQVDGWIKSCIAIADGIAEQRKESLVEEEMSRGQKHGFFFLFVSCKDFILLFSICVYRFYEAGKHFILIGSGVSTADVCYVIKN